MIDVNIHKAKTELSKLLALVEQGEEVVISRRNVPVAKLVSISKVRTEKRNAGALAHLCKNLPEDLFLKPMSEEEISDWE